MGSKRRSPTPVMQPQQPDLPVAVVKEDDVSAATQIKRRTSRRLLRSQFLTEAAVSGRGSMQSGVTL
jgi:hypothetical protein